MNSAELTTQLTSDPAVVMQRMVGPTAREIYKNTTRNRRYVKKLRRIGASNYEIANALGIKETDPVLQE